MILLKHPCSSSRRVRRVLLLAAALVAPGCQLAFGTYSGNVSQDTGGTAGAGGAATGGIATYGGAPSGGEATGAGGTVSSGGCDSTAGACPNKCSTSDPSRCGDPTDAGTPLFVCEKPQVGFIQSDTCRGDLYCESGVNYCVTCKANETHCVPDKDAGALTSGKRCNSNQTGWDQYTCKNRLCQPDGGGGTPDICDICVEESTLCTDSMTLRKCIGGEWQTETCSSGCQPSQGPNPAQCIVN